MTANVAPLWTLESTIGFSCSVRNFAARPSTVTDESIVVTPGR
ncbi:hypothetical protein [Kutzneria sp. 744]|nr:hypothetical protein [Kutzneria sp. 744]